MPELSPAAQAVLDAVEAHGKFRYKDLAAAALEALADQVVPEGRALMIRMPEADVDGNELGGMLLTAEPNDRIRSDILRIAAELRGGQADG